MSRVRAVPAPRGTGCEHILRRIFVRVFPRDATNVFFFAFVPRDGNWPGRWDAIHLVDGIGREDTIGWWYGKGREAVVWRDGTGRKNYLLVVRDRT